MDAYAQALARRFQGVALFVQFAPAGVDDCFGVVKVFASVFAK